MPDPQMVGYATPSSVRASLRIYASNNRLARSNSAAQNRMAHYMRLQKGILEPVPHLTGRQLEVLRFIWQFYRESEDYPTHREIAAAIGAQSTNVAPWLNALVRKDVIVKKPQSGPRNIRLTAVGIEVLKRAGEIAGDESLEF